MTDGDLSRLQQHKHYPYRACAPHWDNPAVCAADDRVSIEVFMGQDSEPQKDRLEREQTAKQLCGGCPIKEACVEYAIGDGRLVRERHQVWGGTTAHERRTILAARLRAAQGTQPAPLPYALLRTRQKQDVLAAVAAHTDLGKQAAAAGLDERTTAWQIARLHTLLRVPAGHRTRQRLLDAARAAGVLPEPAPEVTPGPAAEPDRTAAAVRPSRLPNLPRCGDIPGQMALDVGPAAQPRLRIVPTLRAARRCAEAGVASLLTFDLLEAAA
ncbi:MAG: putative Transcriptional regulator WhiB [Frankiales bacterium]|nr:putative Transcriptional regulator WhiB [Frankiales bacterium]